MALPETGNIIPSIRTSCREARIAANIQIHTEAVQKFLHSKFFQTTFHALSTAHGVQMPLKFPSVLSELNLISILSLLNFAHGYRVPLRKATGRGAYDSIRALVLSLFLYSSEDEDLMSARGLQSISSTKIAEIMQLTNHIHIDKPHPTIPGITIGELGGPLYELVNLITSVLNETGKVLVQGGYPNLGAFILESLKEGERVGKINGTAGVDVEVVLDRIIRVFPAFQDVGQVQGQTVYVFKKVLFLLHALVLRFQSSDASVPPPIPLPNTNELPVFSDNVLPSMLVHVGVLDVSEAKYEAIRRAFADIDVQSNLDYTPTVEQGGAVGKGSSGGAQKLEVAEGPVLTAEEAYAIRAAAVDACEVVVDAARKLVADNFPRNLNIITLPELDGWLWAVAKEGRMRTLNRFAQPGTVFY